MEIVGMEARIRYEGKKNNFKERFALIYYFQEWNNHGTLKEWIHG